MQRQSKSLNSCYRRFDKKIKSQISSTKLQINLKFQDSMTKIFVAVVPYRFGNFDPPVVIPFGTKVRESCVWNFEFGSLEFVWNLVLGAWNVEIISTS